MFICCVPLEQMALPFFRNWGLVSCAASVPAWPRGANAVTAPNVRSEIVNVARIGEPYDRTTAAAKRWEAQGLVRRLG